MHCLCCEIGLACTTTHGTVWLPSRILAHALLTFSWQALPQPSGTFWRCCIADHTLLPVMCQTRFVSLILAPHLHVASQEHLLLMATARAKLLLDDHGLQLPDTSNEHLHGASLRRKRWRSVLAIEIDTCTARAAFSHQPLLRVSHSGLWLWYQRAGALGFCIWRLEHLHGAS